MIRSIAVVLLLLSAAAHAGPQTTPQAAACASQAYAPYAEAMSEWERRQAEFISTARTEFTPGAVLNGQAGGLEWSRTAYRIKYLALNAPARLDLGNGLAGLGLFDWTRTDEFRLRASEPDYPAVADRASQLRTQYRQHPKRLAMENYVEKTLLSDRAYLGRLQSLSAAVEAAGREFDRCKPLLAQTAPPQKEKKPVSRID